MRTEIESRLKYERNWGRNACDCSVKAAVGLFMYLKNFSKAIA